MSEEEKEQGAEAKTEPEEKQQQKEELEPEQTQNPGDAKEPKKSFSDINPQLEPGHNSKQITAADAKCDTVSLFCEYFIENIANLEKEQSYNFVVIAIDEKENEYNSESERIFVQIE